MPPGDEDKRQQFIEQDRMRSGSGPSTLKANTTVPQQPQSSPATGRVPEEDEEKPVKPEKDSEEPEFPWSSYEEGVASANKKRLTGQKMVRESATALSKAGVVLDSNGDPKYIFVEGIGLQPIENVRNLDPSIAALIQQHELGQQMIDEAEDELEILGSLKKAGYFPGDGSGSGIDEDEEFRKKVKFYADIAKDIMALQREEVDMNIAGVKGTADIMAKAKENKILIPGQQVYVPTTPNQNMWLGLQQMAGIKPGVVPNVPKELWNDPNAYAKAIGVPGYAKGTKPNAYNTNMTGRHTGKARQRFSSFIANRRRMAR